MVATDNLKYLQTATGICTGYERQGCGPDFIDFGLLPVEKAAVWAMSRRQYAAFP